MALKGEETAYHLPFLGLKLSLYSSSTAGIRNANVFPLPVLAAPSKSLPGNKDNIAVKKLLMKI